VGIRPVVLLATLTGLGVSSIRAAEAGRKARPLGMVIATVRDYFV
jgi:hypothetical protein